jgi:hypothetical protein
MATRKTRTRKATPRRRTSKTASRRATTRRAAPHRAARKPAARKPCRRCLGGVRYIERKLGASGKIGVWDRMSKRFVRMHANECKVLFGDDAHRWFEFLTSTERDGAEHFHRGGYEIFPATDGTFMVYYGRKANVLKEGFRSLGGAKAYIRRGTARRAIRCTFPRRPSEAQIQLRAAAREMAARNKAFAKQRATEAEDALQKAASKIEIEARKASMSSAAAAARFEREVEEGRRSRDARSNPRRKGHKAARPYRIVRRGWGWGY